jgi:N-acetylneuraminic acid mutarotase
MIVENRVRHCILGSLLGLALSADIPAALGQIQTFAKVDPNAAATNGTAEIYDAATGVFTSVAGTMVVARKSHVATLLQNAKVLITGGFNGGCLASGELYDPDLGTFAATSGGMTAARAEHTATVLKNGRVLVTGGTSGATILSSAEIYDPSDDTFSTTSTSLVAARSGHTATLLEDGTVLIAGGYNGSYLNSAEIFDPDDSTFTATGSMDETRAGHTATLLSDGRVLIAGGRNSDYLSSAEIYDPSTKEFTTASAMTVSRHGHSATLLSSGKVLIIGGFNGSYLNSAEVFDPAAGKFTAVSNGMTAAREGHAAVLLSTGRVLVTGGRNGDYLDSAEIYDPAAGTFASSANSMAVARQLHSATVLSDGRVLVAGGLNTSLLKFDINLSSSDNIAPNIVISNDSGTGFVAYTGSGVVLAFSTATGEVLKKIQTGGYPAAATATPDGKTLAVVSVLDNRVFVIDMQALTLKTTFTFDGAVFGFGSIITLSPDGQWGYLSSGGSYEALKFSMSTGQISARLKGLQTPTQITVTPDGATLLIVDVTAVQLVIADAGSMTRKSAIKPTDTVSTATLSMYNKAVLDPTGTFAILPVRSKGGSGYSGSILVFKVPSGQVLFSGTIGSQPGYTGLRPNGQDWVILNESSISLITCNDPGAKQEIPTAQGYPLSSANIAFSPDSTYAYYVSSATDLVFQHDLSTQGVVGQVLVGDSPNKGLEQPATVAITPDGKTVAALEFIGNTVDLLRKATTLEGAKFVLSGNQFSGVSLVNLSSRPTTFTLYALDNYGQVISGDDLENPVEIAVPGNGQISAAISGIFNFDSSTDHAGRLEVFADQPRVAGYMSVGRIAATWFGYYLSRMDGSPMFTGRLYDWIIPEVATASEEPVQFDIVSTNFAQQTYDLHHYLQDGTLADEKTDQIAYPTNRTEQEFSTIFSSSGTRTVLITGGQNDNSTTLSSAEKLDTSGQVFSSAGAMKAVRQGHTATLLFDQKVLIAGGENSSTVLDTAELYDISEGTFTETEGPMTTNRSGHTATRLASGKVLIAGGKGATSENATAELYDPDEDTFTSTAGPMPHARTAHTAVLLPSGKVLVSGGMSGNAAISHSELFNPGSGLFESTGTMISARGFHTATRLVDGRILLAGGYNGTDYLKTAEIYDPVKGTCTATAGSMAAQRGRYTATLLSDGTVLLAGGSDANGPVQTAEIYDPSADAFTLLSDQMTSMRTGHTATLVSKDQVVLIGGSNGTEVLDTAEIYDVSSRSFTAATDTMLSGRTGHTATALQFGGEGYVRATSKGGLLFTEYFSSSRDNAALNGIDVLKYTGVTRLYSPQFANIGSFKTYLSLINANPEQDAQVTITLHAADGRVLGDSLLYTLPRNAKLRGDLSDLFARNPAAQNAQGWLEVSSSCDRLVGTVSFNNSEDTYLTSFELSGIPLKQFVFPLTTEDGQYQTAIAILNANDVTATVKAELWNPDGSIDRTAVLTLQPHSRMAQYLSDLFPGMEARVAGNVRIGSDQPVHGVSLINDRELHFLAAVPAIPFP